MDIFLAILALADTIISHKPPGKILEDTLIREAKIAL